MKTFFQPCKRVLSLLLVFACLFFAGCNSDEDDSSSAKKNLRWKPDHVSSEIEPYVERAIEIIDAYLAFDISASEADVAFEELIARLEPLGVTDRDLHENFTDIMTAYSIIFFKYDNVSELTDSELRQKRDAFAFQIGEEVSGRAYPLEKTSRLFDDDAPEYLQVFNAPVAEAHFFESDSCGYISLTFDAINGIAPLDLLEYINDLMDILSKRCEADVSISLTYEYYEQLVFLLMLDISNNNVTGWLSTHNRDGQATNLVTINSVKDIEIALNAGAKYLGNHKVP
jgi:hypothetical protein